MRTRHFVIGLAVVVGLATVNGPTYAAEEKTEEKKDDTTRVKASNAFMNRWKKIQKVTKKQAYETQQTRTVAGVRGAEAEDAVLDQLYYKGGVRYPSRVDLKNAITQLETSIKADPEGEAVAEQKYFIAQCHVQLGELDAARKVYGDLVENHADSPFAEQAAGELKGIE